MQLIFGFSSKTAPKSSVGFTSPIFSGVMTVVMGIVAMVRITRQMRLTDTTLYSSSMHVDDTKVKGNSYELTEPTITMDDYMMMMKRMNELEERVSGIAKKPETMPPEKEEMLNNALDRVNALEQELSSTKKVITDPILVLGVLLA